jgi:Rho termination factor, N-terminal domain
VLRKAVLDHAEHEEQEEFPRLRSSLSPVQLEAMGVAARVAEAMAPTHPHPEVNYLAANLMVGPMLAFADRTRDLVRDAVQRSRPVGLDAQERSVKELRERARELQLPGRSSMRKDELVAALRKQPK